MDAAIDESAFLYKDNIAVLAPSYGVSWSYKQLYCIYKFAAERLREGDGNKPNKDALHGAIDPEYRVALFVDQGPLLVVGM